MRFFITSFNNQTSTPVDPPIVINPTTEIVIDNTRWIAGSINNVQISVSSGLLETSIDGGATFPYSYSTATADLVISCFMFKNENILLLLNDNRFFLTDATLSHYTEKFMLDTDGVSLYPTPLAGYYFAPHGYHDYQTNTNMYLWGLYGDVVDSGVRGLPVGVFYSNDFGVTLKTALKFDDIPQDPRHVHFSAYNEYDDIWLVSTGDKYSTGSFSESLWMEGSYNETLGTWSWVMIDFGQPITWGNETSRLKNVGFYFREIAGESYIYWGAETNLNTPDQRGIWKSKYSEFSDMTKHIRVLEFPTGTEYKILDLKCDNDTGLVLGVVSNEGYDNTSQVLLIAKDYGEGAYQVHDYGTPWRFRGPTNGNTNGFYRLDTNFRNTLQGKTYWIKLGLDLFENTIGEVYNIFYPTFKTSLSYTNVTTTTVDITITTDDNNIVKNFDIYVNGSLHETTPNNPSVTVDYNLSNYTVTGLTSGVNYDMYLVARDTSDNLSANSTTINFTTL